MKTASHKPVLAVFAMLLTLVPAPAANLGTKRTLTLEIARSIAAAAEKKATENKWAMVVAVLDDGGNLLQLERMDGALAPSQREYFRFFGLDREKLAHAAPGVKVMHPGPMNRGVEIDSEVADDLAVSLIQDQVEMGVAARMAVLTSLAARLDNDR